MISELMDYHRWYYVGARDIRAALRTTTGALVSIVFGGAKLLATHENLFTRPRFAQYGGALPPPKYLICHGYP